MKSVFQKTLYLLKLLTRENYKVQERIFNKLDTMLDVQIVPSDLALALKEVNITHMPSNRGDRSKNNNPNKKYYDSKSKDKTRKWKQEGKYKRTLYYTSLCKSRTLVRVKVAKHMLVWNEQDQYYIVHE